MVVEDSDNACPKHEQNREKVSMRAKEAVDAIRELIRFASTEVEERIAMQDKRSTASLEKQNRCWTE